MDLGPHLGEGAESGGSAQHLPHPRHGQHRAHAGEQLHATNSVG